jgi:hypothetical protein
MGKIKTLALIGIGFTAGYLTKDYQKNTAEYFDIRADNISYQGHMQRPIQIQRNAIVVGTLKQRLEDLLYENPYLIKQTVEELYGELKPATKPQTESTYEPTEVQQPKSLWEKTKNTFSKYNPF